MKYIKLFESTIEDVEQTQLSKLAVLKFSRKITEIFQDYYKLKIRLKEEEKTYQTIANYKLRYGGETSIFSFTIQGLFYGLNKNIEIYYDLRVWSDLKYFIDDLFNEAGDKKYSRHILTIDELNEMSDNIIDEWNFFIDVKKYNL